MRREARASSVRCPGKKRRNAGEETEAVVASGAVRRHNRSTEKKLLKRLGVSSASVLTHEISFFGSI